ncbi:unnamed protein product [Bursaphelenchus okinawaensis]|uniref:G-protein coupled receptors family 1 profile domain-containing protein n=1 Tax=Bursaphelenchus okinawaensis TaxID=465554 RepID=A0A811KRQ2_9BILA|nr:unnamed protein product [Bursaphelenchus okinawaensis]CAG9110521.1 unnamed protein product [Bursaphelenchus okinawaensis]
MDELDQLDTIRQPFGLVIIYTTFYAFVFLLGLIGNVFVLLAIIWHPTLRSTTDYMISSLASADLLIIVFCLPTTLLNNLLTEWQLGAVGCKLSTFINSTTSCASIFTLVAVTADRYLAICHTLKYAMWEASYTLYVILAIWVTSAVLASPNLVFYDEVLYDLLPPNGTLVARLCVSTQDDFLHFIIVNLIIAFIVPTCLISVSYALIFKTVSNHRSLAVDARIRDERVKLRVATMMLTVIIVFMLCWTPLYALYCYFFMASDKNSAFFQFASSILRPIFQWLSLLSSSINPLVYIGYSQKYRRAFHTLLLLPCQMKYNKMRSATRTTFRLSTERSNNEKGAISPGQTSKKYTLLGPQRRMTTSVAAWPDENSNGTALGLRRASQPHFLTPPLPTNGVVANGKDKRSRTPPPNVNGLATPNVQYTMINNNFGPVSQC